MKLSELMLTVEELCGMSVSVEVINQNLIRPCLALRLPQDQYLHHSEACRRIKFSSEVKACQDNKTRSTVVARCGRSFCGYCPNGVWDLAVPVVYQENAVAVVYLGGVLSAPDEAKIRELRTHGRFIAQFIVFELRRYAKQSAPHRKRRDEQFYISNSCSFIKEKYNEQISLAELAETMNVNPEHLGKLIQRKLGKTFRELLCEHRMNQGEVLVRLHTMLNFTQIARLCGFTDSNYFSVVFKNHFGMPPKAYRAKYRRR